MKQVMSAFCMLASVVLFQGQARTILIPQQFATIQAGIDDAVDGDTVLVYEGEYRESIFFNGKKIVVASLFFVSGDTSFISSTVIRHCPPPSQPGTTFHGEQIFFSSREDSSSVFCGFTCDSAGICIQDTAHPSIHHLRLNRTSGVEVETSAPVTFSDMVFNGTIITFSIIREVGGITIRRSKFESASVAEAFSSGTIHLDNNLFVKSSVSIKVSKNSGGIFEITSNRFVNSAISLRGGGDRRNAVRISNNVFSIDDSAQAGRSSISCTGTGFDTVAAIITGNRFEKTGIHLGGTGGLQQDMIIAENHFIGDSTFTSELICGGVGDNCSGPSRFAGITCIGTGNCRITAAIDENKFDGADLTIGGTGYFTVHASIQRNIFTQSPKSAIYLHTVASASYVCELVNNTIVNNRAGIKKNGAGSLDIVNTIVWGNDTDLVGIDLNQIRYSIWNSGLVTGGEGNIAGDPLLRDVAARDFSLTSASPCIDRGDPASVPDPDGSAPDIGALPFNHKISDPTGITLSPVTENLKEGASSYISRGVLHLDRLKRQAGSMHAVRLFDMNGKLIHTVRVGPEIDCLPLHRLSLSRGTYIVRITRTGGWENTLRYIR